MCTTPKAGTASQQPQELSGQVAVVTGASSGIGRAIALELAEAGADVFIHARASRRAADAAAAAICSRGQRSHSYLCDLAEENGRKQLFKNAWNWQGRVDIWINNAGADVLTGSAADWSFSQKLEQLWRVDVTGSIELSRLAGEAMLEINDDRVRSILNIGWDQAETGMGGESGEMFAAAKGAIMAFSRSLAKSLAPKVRVNCLAPGWIQTAWGETASEYWQARARGESLRNRWGRPDDVARAARFISSPAADFISGQILHVNGGRP